ncbi:isopeptide-forming domain-containing fimbrial protein [Georgenia sp. MJ173]|uniref:DUF7927 domain-containing protein n=1 Tax=Georgenia sunbinii TaxID=3117728 RepID=UPI002F268A1E
MLTGAVLPLTATAAVEDEITGTIWQDYDSNGVFDSFESGLAGIEVIAYDGEGNVAGPATTGEDGNYVLPVTSDADRWRVEANLPDTPQWSQWRDSVVGRAGEPSNGTTVQFADVADGVGASGVDFSFQVPSAYVENNPNVFVPVMHYGPSDGMNATAAAGTTIRYDAESPAGGALVPQTAQVPFSQVGATNGSAVARPTAPGEPATVLTAAYIRRHVGVGPEGIGAIYRVTPDGDSWEVPTASADLYVDVTDFGIDLGGPDQSAPAGDPHGLRPDVTADNPQYDWMRDAQAWGQVGRSGLGTIALSADEQYLYAVNLHNRSLIQVETGGSVDLLPANVTEIELDEYFPDDSDLRPYGVSANPLTNEMYLTVTDTAETTQDVADLHGYVYSFDPANPGDLREVLSFPLDFTRTGFNPTWFPWATDISDIRLQGAVIRSAMPVVGDAKYLHGDLVIGVRDLAGDLFGGQAYISGDPADGNAVSAQIRSEGDVYIAAPAGDGSFVLEDNGVHRGIDGDGAAQGDGGPGGLRYFDTGYTQFNQDNEALGSIVVVPSRADGVLTTGVHAANGAGQSGVRRLFQEGGQAHDPRGAVIIHGFQQQPDVTSKGNGLGSAAALASAAPIEIGNYVWYDVDNDGVQDPDEAPVEGATVNLYEVAEDGTRTLVSTTTTSALGEYYFSSNDEAYALATNTDYVVGIDAAADYAEGGPLFGWYPTVENTGDEGSLDADRNDSDGIVEETADGSFPYAAITTGGPGENDHTIDFGYSQVDYEFDKSTVSGPVENGDGTWTVTYDLVVGNPSDVGGSYELSDDLTGYGAGIEVVATEVLDGPTGAALNEDWDGTEDQAVITESFPIAAGSTEEAGTAHAYTLEVTVALSVDEVTGEVLAGTEALTCTPDQVPGAGTTGLFNAATLVPAGHENITDTECGDLPRVELDKTVASEPTVVDRDELPGVWEVVYGLTVTNETAVDTTYDLVDSLRFGTGVDIVSVEAASVDPAGVTLNADFDGVSDTLVVADQPIDGDAVHTYEVTVRYTLDLPNPPAQPDPSDCSLVEGSTESTGLLNGATVTYNGYPSTDSDCREVGQPTHDKELVSAVPVGDGQWAVVYDITVANLGAGATLYDLDDTLRYAEGITVVSTDVVDLPPGVTPAEPAWDGAEATRIATSVPLAGTGDGDYAPHVYRLEVLADVPLQLPGAGSGDDTDPTVCADLGGDPTLARALTNTSTLTDESGLTEDDFACAEPPSISIDKGISEGPVAGGDGTWTVTYDIVATNNGGGEGVYDVSDAMDPSGDLVVEDTAVVTTPDGVSALEAWTGLGEDGAVENLIAADVPLAGGEVHTYQVEVVLSVDATDGVVPVVTQCSALGEGETGGLSNSAGLEHNDLTDEATACVTVGYVQLGKTISEGPTANGDGTFTVLYDVVAENVGGAAADYEITDRLMFGGDVQLESAAVVTAPEGVETNADWTGLGDAGADENVIAQGVTLEAEGTHTYQVQAVVSLDEAELDLSTLQCPPPGSAGTGGLANSAGLTHNGIVAVGEACASLPVIELDKTVSEGPVANGDFTWTITYDVVVENVGEATGTYDVADELRYGPGAVIESAAVVTTPTDVAIPADWTGQGETGSEGNVIAEGVTLEAGGLHTYQVEVVVSLDMDVAVPGGLQCPEPGSGEAGGLTNTAGVVHNGESADAVACAALEVPALELTKSSDPASGETVLPGEVITYTVTGTNTGETVLDPAVLTDDLSGVLAHAGYNDDVTATIGGVATGEVALEGTTLTWTGVLAAGQEVELTYSVTVDEDAAGAVVDNIVTGSATPPNGPPIVPPPGQTEHPVPGFDLDKVSDPSSGSTVLPGEDITYTVTGTNTGATVLDPVVITDDLSEVLAHAEYNGDAVAVVDGEEAGELAVVGTTLTWTGELAVGQSVTITYSVAVDEDAAGAVVANTVTGEATPPGLPPLVPPPVGTEHPVPGFEITKISDPASGTVVDASEVITYTVTGTNTGATVLDPVVLTDDMSEVLAHAEYNVDAVAVVGDAESGELVLEGTTLTWTGVLAVGEQVTVSYSVTVNEDAAGALVTNTVTGEGTPPGRPPLDPPPVTTEHPVPVPGFDLRKASDPVSGTEVHPGEVVTYTVTGTNTGETALDPVVITDDLSEVLAHAESNGDAVAVVGEEEAGELVLEGTTLTWTGALAVGEQVKITYSVTVSPEASGQLLTNTVTGQATPPGAPPIVPPPTSTEHPVPVPGFELDKTSDPISGSTVMPGETITYTVTGTNTGGTVLDPVVITDDLSEVLNHADYNGDAVAVVGQDLAGELVVEGTALAWAGQLAVGEQVTITYSVTVHEDAAGAVVTNTVAGAATPPGLPPIVPPEVSTEHPVPGFELDKVSDPESGTEVRPGERITYTVTGTNTGATVLDPVVITDDLSEVLAHAEYNGDAVAVIGEDEAGELAVVGSTLTWDGELAVGEEVTITYSVTVDEDAAGVTVRNVVSGEATPPGGTTLVPPPVGTEHPVPELGAGGTTPRPGLPTTGTHALAAGLSALLLLGAGATLVGRRRQWQR